MEEKMRKTGIDVIGDVPWGTHFCQFYQTKQDLIDILVPYFEAGLLNNEFCMWITSEPLRTKEAIEALGRRVKNLDDRIKKGQIEMLDYTEWYTKSGRFNADEVLQAWVEKEKQALKKGFDGLRLTGNTLWLEKKDWESFKDYEAAINSVISEYRMLAVCTYSLDKCTASEIMDVVSNHQFALIKREGKWEIIESAEHKKRAEALQESEQKYRAIFEQAADSVVLIDTETGTLTEFNARAHETLGYTREEFRKLKITDFEIIESARQVSKHIEKIVEQGADTFETKHRTKSGEIRDILVSSKAISIGGRDFILSIWRDITERKNAMEDLRISEANYHAIFDSANDAIFVHDIENGKILSVNQKACEMFGYAREELERLTVEDLSMGVPPYDQEHAMEWIKKKAEKGTQLVEWTCKDKTGTSFWTEVNLKLAVIQGENRILAIFREIGERKQAELALKLHDLRLQALLDLNKLAGASQQEILDFVREGIIKVTQSQFAFIGFMNEDESVQTTYAWSKEVMEGCAIVETPRQFPVAQAGLWGEAVRQRRPIIINDYAAPHPHKKGYPKGHVPIKRFLCIPVFDSERIVAVAAVANKQNDYDESDVRALTSMMNDAWRLVQRKRIQEALQENERRFRTLFRHAGDALFVIEPETGRFVDVNRRACRALGYTRQELLNLSVPDIDPIYPKDKFSEFVRTIKKGKPVTVEAVHQRKDGTTFPVEIRTGFIEIEEKPRLLSLARDITERKQAEEQIENLAKFPSEDPNPVLRVARDGTLLYANDASSPLLAEWQCQVGQVIPENWHQTISEVFAFGSYRRVEAKHAGRVFAFVVAPVPEVDYVNLYGRDITERKDAEARRLLAAKILERLNQKSERLDLIRDIIKLVKEFTGFAAVGVRLREGEDFPYFRVNGFSDDFVQAENYLCARNEKGEQICDAEGRPVLACMCGSVIVGRADPALPFFTEGGSFWTNSTTELLACTSPEAFQVPVRSRCNEAGYESVALIPLRSGDEIVGLLQLNDNRAGQFTPEVVRFFEEVGASIGIALARIRAEEQVVNLAKFPSENPNPVLRIAADSTVLYANAAGAELLQSWGSDVGGKAPEHWHQYIARILKRAGPSEQLEVVCRDTVFSLIMAPVVEAGYVNVYGIDITERKLAEEDLRKYRLHLEELVQSRTAELTEANEQLLQEVEARKRLEKEILNVSERERRRIGQELHDSLGQQLTGVAFMTKVLEQKLVGKSVDEAADVADIGKLVGEATDQARSLAKGLHPVDLDAGTLASALHELATSTERLFGVGCTFECGKRVEIESPEVAVHLYRITQEAITNAIKHGKARNIRIRLAYGRNKSALTVGNDGLDFPKEFEARGTGMGLQIMDHRVDIIGGSLDIRKAPEGGTVVVCTFPKKTH